MLFLLKKIYYNYIKDVISMKLNIGVIFGGKSVEHDMSIITALQAMNNIDTDKYDITPIYITKDNIWYTGGCLRYIETFKDYDLIKRYAKRVNLINKDNRFILQSTTFLKREVSELHVAFPIVHGAGIEDGSIQGFLNIVGIPYIGSNVYSSAVSQDKAFVKQILVANDINTTKFVWFGERYYQNKKSELFKQIDKLKYPLIIKPATLGSSIGIEIIKRKEELDSTIERVFKYDSKVIIEEKIEDVTEYNCSVLVTDNGNITSEIEKVTTNKDIVEYTDRMIIEDGSDSSIKREVPADITESLRKEIETTSLHVFKMLNMRGSARIDFLYDNNNKTLYVDEVNSIPYCYAHHLWEKRNISYKELLNIMIKEAIDRQVKSEEMIFTIDTDIIKNTTSTKLREMK